MTRMLFWEDPYQGEFSAQVISANGNDVTLGSTCFFFSSGGQPSDTGEIEGIRVLDVHKGDDGVVVHVLQGQPTFKPGQLVRGRIDWERRYRIMRLHSACHVMSGVLLKSFNIRKHTGIRIYPDKARMDFDMGKLDHATAQEIETEANRIVQEHRDIVARIASWEEVDRDPELKTVSENRYETIEVPRILEIIGFDKQLDGGTHVRNTAEIGKIKIVKTENKGRNNKRLTLIIE